MRFKGMRIENVIKRLEAANEEFTVDRYDDTGEIFSVTIGEYWADHIDLEVEDGKVVYVDYCQWD